MWTRACILSLIAAVMAVAVSAAAQAQTYPSRPIRIVTAEAGGGGDFVARLIATGLRDSFSQPVIVDNRSSGVIPGEIVAKATPDGYTLLNYGSTLWIGSLLRKTSYDPVRDFAPVTLSQSSPCILAVPLSSTASSVRDLIALAKAKPGQLNYASVAVGSVTHLGAELFKSMAAVDIVHVNYKGTGAAINDLVSGQMQLMFATAGSIAPQIKSGRLKALAVTSLQPSALMPGLPTVASSGLPGYEATSLNGVLAPAGTPRAIIGLLNREITRVLNQPDVKAAFLKTGVESAPSSPDAFAATIKDEMKKWGTVIREAGIRVE